MISSGGRPQNATGSLMDTLKWDLDFKQRIPIRRVEG